MGRWRVLFFANGERVNSCLRCCKRVEDHAGVLRRHNIYAGFHRDIFMRYVCAEFGELFRFRLYSSCISAYVCTGVFLLSLGRSIIICGHLKPEIKR